MELSRAEFKLKQPPNYGERLFQRLEKQKHEHQEGFVTKLRFPFLGDSSCYVMLCLEFQPGFRLERIEAEESFQRFFGLRIAIRPSLRASMIAWVTTTIAAAWSSAFPPAAESESKISSELYWRITAECSHASSEAEKLVWFSGHEASELLRFESRQAR